MSHLDWVREAIPYQMRMAQSVSTHSVDTMFYRPSEEFEFVGMDSYLTPGKCKCSYCGQYGSRQRACTHCGAVID